MAREKTDLDIYDFLNAIPNDLAATFFSVLVEDWQFSCLLPIVYRTNHYLQSDR
jgi:hypothetical protein